MLQQQQQHQQNQVQPIMQNLTKSSSMFGGPLNVPLLNINQLLHSYTPNHQKNWQMDQNRLNNCNDSHLDRVARFHRSSAGNKSIKLLTLLQLFP